MEGAPARPTVVVAGAGAAGTLSALHLVRTASRRTTALDVVLVDPVDRWARGVAFGTPDEAHLLNVPASGMSALPEDPGHFVGWLGRQGDGAVADPNAFAPRRQFALYLDDVLTRELAAAEGLVSLKHLRSEATGVGPDRDGLGGGHPRRLPGRGRRRRRGHRPPAGRQPLGAARAARRPRSSSPTRGRPARSTSYAGRGPARPTSSSSAPA